MDSLLSEQRSRCSAGSWHSWESGRYCCCVTSIAFLSRRSLRNGENRESQVTGIRGAVTKLPPACNDLSVISIFQFRFSILSIDSRGKGLRGRRGVCASAKDDEACEGLWLRSGECVRG